jgi:hypothetical protein
VSELRQVLSEDGLLVLCLPANLPQPDVLAVEIVAGLEVALEQFREIAEELGNGE